MNHFIMIAGLILFLAGFYSFNIAEIESRDTTIKRLNEENNRLERDYKTMAQVAESERGKRSIFRQSQELDIGEIVTDWKESYVRRRGNKLDVNYKDGTTVKSFEVKGWTKK